MSKITAFFEKKLEKRLSKLNVEELISEMNNERYYFPYNIFRKIFERNLIINSGKRISWFATRQAEKLNDKSDFEKLKTIIDFEHSKDESVRSAYFCIGHLAKNTKDKSMFDYLMYKLDNEINKKNNPVILFAISKIEKPKTYNLNPIFEYLKSKKLKHDAVYALRNSSNPNVEIELLKLLQTEKNKNLHTTIATVLSEVGTEKSLIILEELLQKGKGNDYKYFIERAIESIKEKM